ncbi:hypothetical protein [Mucilaginibacter sp. 21P]|uniref:hypothetical protein n=1 Tax=Mucilaginibacter sp. 21P TaxID=2778902 RepID=UPI001C598BAD|nr:hypothetical protein [Mucilaginibacter sp. 21P]
MTNIEVHILHCAIEQLDASSAFKGKCLQMNFRSLQEIIDTAPAVLQEKPGFDYTWFTELINLLSKEKLLHKLQPLPGNNPY